MYEGSSTDILQQIMSVFYARTILHNLNSLPTHKCNRQVSDYYASVTTILSLILTYFSNEITKDIMWLHKAILSTILYFLYNNMSLILILTDSIPYYM